MSEASEPTTPSEAPEPTAASEAPAPSNLPPEPPKRAKQAAIALILLGMAAALLILVWGSVPLGYASGRVIGDPQKVVIVDPMRGLIVEGILRPDGTYLCPIPRTAQDPAIVIHGPGTSVVRTLPFKPTDTELPPVAIWSEELRIRTEDGVLRFDWPPIPEGEGYPAVRRYSLLFTYKKENGEKGEASLLSRNAYMTLPQTELEDLLKDWDPKQREVSISLRAFHSAETDGALWVASERAWTLPEAQEKPGQDR